MERINTDLEGVFIIKPKVFGDNRGFFMETWNQERYSLVGLSQPFVQDNLSQSKRGVLRGLHYQLKFPQGKLLYVLQGEIFDVAVDIRVGSPTFGEWTGVTLSAENRLQFYIDKGFAHGFVVVSETALVAYKCTESYRPEDEKTILWNDPDIAIEWPKVSDLTLSEKDKNGVPINKMPRSDLPLWLPPHLRGSVQSQQPKSGFEI